jgi:archaeal type IV pilus assembly protein PilA
MSFPVARTFKYQMLAIPTPVGQTTQKSEERKRMNVLGKNERSWRKARKRGVSPIIATILLVAITVVLAAVLYVLISGLTHGPGNTPIGTAFQAGAPVSSTCAGGGTVATTGCLAGDQVYTMTIESSSVTFGSVSFEVKAPSGAIFAPTGKAAFAIMPLSGAPAAYWVSAAAAGPAAMGTTGWTFTGALTNANPLSNQYTIEIDVGQAASISGLGYTFVALGSGSYQGTTSPVTLP